MFREVSQTPLKVRRLHSTILACCDNYCRYQIWGRATPTRLSAKNEEGNEEGLNSRPRQPCHCWGRRTVRGRPRWCKRETMVRPFAVEAFLCLWYAAFALEGGPTSTQGCTRINSPATERRVSGSLSQALSPSRSCCTDALACWRHVDSMKLSRRRGPAW